MFMNKSLLILCSALTILISQNITASAITQCIQPDGTIEFTNQGCSSQQTRQTKKQLTHISFSSRKTHKRKHPFRQQSFVALQNKLIKAEAQLEIEQHAQAITDKIHQALKTGSLKNAYNMVAATYVKLAKHLKKKQWEALAINNQALRTRALFEEILITQSTVTDTEELTLIIDTAWKNYQEKSLVNIIGRNDP